MEHIKYKNYIFDLYGTLVDIHTDEEKPILWKKMAGYLKDHFDVEYTPNELRKAYLKTCSEEVVSLKKRIKVSEPEIRITWVWARLILDKRHIQTSETDLDKELFDVLRTRDDVPDQNNEETVPSQLLDLCIFFRENSRDKLVKFKDVDRTLSTLREAGRGVYLLSNAQRAFTMKELEEMGLLEYFDDIFISSDKLVKKPDTRFMEMLLDKHALDKKACVMIGNEPGSDVKVADNCGVDSILIEDGDIASVLIQ